MNITSNSCAGLLKEIERYANETMKQEIETFVVEQVKKASDEVKAKMMVKLNELIGVTVVTNTDFRTEIIVSFRGWDK